MEVKNGVGGKPGNDSEQVGVRRRIINLRGDGLMGTRLENRRLRGEREAVADANWCTRFAVQTLVLLGLM